MKKQKRRPTKDMIDSRIFKWFYVTFTYSFIYEFYLSKIPEIITGFADLGRILIQLCMGYNVSFTFYLLVEYFPRLRKTRLIFSSIKTPINEMISNMEIPLRYLFTKVFGDNYDFYNLIQDDFKKVCLSINPCAEAPAATSSQNRLQKVNITLYLFYYIQRVEENVLHIMRYLYYLDERLVVLIESIMYSNYHKLLKDFYRLSQTIGTTNNNFEFMYEQMYEYYLKLLTLKKYVKE